MCRYIFAGFLALFYLGQCVDAKPGTQPVLMPTACEGKKYCNEKDSNYPEDIIESLLMGVNDLWKEVVNTTTTGKRQGIHNNECLYSSLNDAIYVMADENDNLRYVVQNKNRFNQIIDIEECVNPGRIKRRTDQLTQKQVEKHSFECKQKSIDFKFVVLSLDRTKLESVGMKDGVPVCCSCVLTERDNE